MTFARPTLPFHPTGVALVAAAVFLLAPGRAGAACGDYVTIAGQVAPGTPFDPDRIAERYWQIVNSDGDWQSEFRFEGS